MFTHFLFLKSQMSSRSHPYYFTAKYYRLCNLRIYIFSLKSAEIKRTFRLGMKNIYILTHKKSVKNTKKSPFNYRKSIFLYETLQRASLQTIPYYVLSRLHADRHSNSQQTPSRTTVKSKVAHEMSPSHSTAPGAPNGSFRCNICSEGL